MDNSWSPNQQNEIKFILVDSNQAEVTGLGSTFTLKISKAGDNAPVDGLGVKSELGLGWYRYLSTALEAVSQGTVAISVWGAGTIQQNLFYVVKEPNFNAIEFTYTLTSDLDSSPIQGAEVSFSTDSAGSNIVWRGETDSFGVVRDDNSQLPRLDAGTYYAWRQKSGFVFINPDVEVVS